MENEMFCIPLNCCLRTARKCYFALQWLVLNVLSVCVRVSWCSSVEGTKQGKALIGFTEPLNHASSSWERASPHPSLAQQLAVSFSKLSPGVSDVTIMKVKHPGSPLPPSASCSLCPSLLLHLLCVYLLLAWTSFGWLWVLLQCYMKSS